MSRLKRFYIIMSAIFVVTTILVLALEVWGYLKISETQSGLAEQNYRSEQMTKKEEILATLSRNYIKFEKDSAVVNTALPDQKDASKLISDLDSLANESGLKLTGIQSSNFNKKAGISADKSLLQTIKGKNAYELPLEIKISGSYQNFVKYITRLENYQRLVNISSIEISKDQDVGAAPDQINVKLTLTAYLKK